MPRGKFLNYKGRSRQFTPVEQLQRERELEICKTSSTTEKLYEDISSIEESIFVDNNNSKNRIERINEHVNGFRKFRKLGGPAEGLIEISNPNRPIKKPQKTALLVQGVEDNIMDPSLEEPRRERAKEKPRFDSSQKATSEATADLARLAIVRKKREAAAEQRLAAKKEGNCVNCAESTSITPKADVWIKKNDNKYKSGITGTIEFLQKLKVEKQASKLVKGRNGHKRNV